MSAPPRSEPHGMQPLDILGEGASTTISQGMAISWETAGLWQELTRIAAGSSDIAPARATGDLPIRRGRRTRRSIGSARVTWPWRLLSAGHIPALVVSGGHSVVFEAAADDIAERMGGVRRVIAGAGHFVQRYPGFAGLLTGFLRAHKPEPAFRTSDSVSCPS